jgi:hypothetical protein
MRALNQEKMALIATDVASEMPLNDSVDTIGNVVKFSKKNSQYTERCIGHKPS